MPKQAASPVPGGVVSQITASYNFKVSDGDFGSVGVFFSATMDVSPDADADETFDGLYAWVKTVATRNSKQDVAPKQEADAEPATHNADGTESVYKYEALALPDDKYQLLIYPVLGNGNEGKYPITKFTATSKQAFFDMVKPVWDDIEAGGGIPSQGRVEWKAQTAEGREYKGKDGSTKHYTDLVSLSK